MIQLKIFVAFYSKSGTTKRVAEEIAGVLTKKKHAVKLHEIVPVENLKAARYPKDGKGIRLAEPILELASFDFVFVGTPVWGFCPASPTLTFLRQLKGVKGKPFALFSTCTGLPGTTIKRMANILATKGAKIGESLTVKSIFELDRDAVNSIRKFAENALLKVP